MTVRPAPYVEYNPGDLITAESTNEMQVLIKEDILAQVGAVSDALDDFIEGPINATTFDGRTSTEWQTHFDGRYARLDHSHESVRHYQRYFLELETVIAGPGGNDRLQPAVLIHGMGREPVVQVYALLNLPIEFGDRPGGGARRDFKFCVTGPEHSDDMEAAELKTRSWDERHWGDPFDLIVDSLTRDLPPQEAEAIMRDFQDNFTLNAWITRLQQRLFEPGPAQYHFDAGDVYQTQWVRDRGSRRVSELKETGEWPPRFVYRPVLVNGLQALQRRGDNEDTLEPLVGIAHVNLNEVEIAVVSTVDVGDDQPDEAHLMVILRS
jgi:hypothetical protein